MSRRLGRIENALSDGRPYLTGKDYTLADIYFFVVQRWAPMTDVDLTQFPEIVAFDRRVASRPAVVSALEAESLSRAD